MWKRQGVGALPFSFGRGHNRCIVQGQRRGLVHQRRSGAAMTSHPAGPGQSADFRDQEREWLPMAAFAFVVLALIALASLPSLLLRRVARAAEEINTTVLPASDALRNLAFAMEERVTASRSWFLTNDPRYDARLTEAKRAEEDALRALTELAPRFGAATV